MVDMLVMVVVLSQEKILQRLTEAQHMLQDTLQRISLQQVLPRSARLSLRMLSVLLTLFQSWSTHTAQERFLMKR